MAADERSGTYSQLAEDDYPPLNSPGLKAFNRNRSQQFTRRHILIGALVLCTLVLVASIHSTGQVLPAALRITPSEPPPRRGVLYRTGSLTNEGVGSAPQHFKSSLLLAELLDREFVLQPLASEHGYSLSDIFNAGAAARDDLAFELPTCEVDEAGGWLWGELLKACEDPDAHDALRAKFEDKYAGCGTLFHDVKQYDWFQDGNGCVHGWFQRSVRKHVCSAYWTEEEKAQEAAKLAPSSGWWRSPATLSADSAAPVKLGIHFRWGDTQPKPGEEVDRYRGIQVKEVNDAVAALSRCGVPLEVELFAEGLPDEIDARFEFAHSVVDSGDGVQDVCRLGQSDVVIAGASGYAVMAYEVGHNYLQLITDVGIFKYEGTNSTQFTALNVNALDDRVCDYLRRPTPELEME